jgi:hypothetical protein
VAPTTAPKDAPRRWRRHGLTVAILGGFLALATVLPWFARTTILPAGDGHLEVLNAWMSGEAVAPAGSGPAGPLRTVPWGPLLLAVAVAGVVGGLLARRWPPRRGVVLACFASAGLGLLFAGLAWAGAAAGIDTAVVPQAGGVVAVAILVAWLAVAGTMLRAGGTP